MSNRYIRDGRVWIVEHPEPDGESIIGSVITNRIEPNESERIAIAAGRIVDADIRAWLETTGNGWKPRKITPNGGDRALGDVRVAKRAAKRRKGANSDV